MAFSLEDYCKLRPFSYHLTASSNAGEILRLKQLVSAEQIFTQANSMEFISEKRKTSSSVLRDGVNITVRDQAPLHSGNMSLPTGYTFADFVKYLNKHVYFWPGDEFSPIGYGLRHFSRYQDEAPTIFRICTTELFKNNPAPLFSKCNSGSPRWSRGKIAPRGPDTFTSGLNSNFPKGKVVELVFVDEVALGNNFQYKSLGSKTWLKP